ncbi:hypothetical protein INE89_04269 [Bacteroides thetaiotaomicron]|nr:hypothetical protein INE89_04269 [Bacteroides thetaiotaomicron]
MVVEYEFPYKIRYSIVGRAYLSYFFRVTMNYSSIYAYSIYNIPHNLKFIKIR